MYQPATHSYMYVTLNDSFDFQKTSEFSLQSRTTTPIKGHNDEILIEAKEVVTLEIGTLRLSMTPEQFDTLSKLMQAHKNEQLGKHAEKKIRKVRDENNKIVAQELTN